MCRIFGFAGNLSEPNVRIIRGLILAEEKGNPHGTGIVVHDQKESQFLLQKKGIRGLHYIARGYADFLYDLMDKPVKLIGHVRFKTSGDATDRNAHPFGASERDTWHFLIHNGVLGWGMSAVAEKFNANVTNIEVDSEIFLRCVISQVRRGVDIVEAISSVTYEVSDIGDFAFSLLNDKCIYLWKNDQRPAVVLKKEKDIFFASTKSMFEDALQIAGVSTRGYTAFEVEPYKLYKIQLTSDAGEADIKIVTDIPRKKRILPERTFSSYSRYSSYFSPKKYESYVSEKKPARKNKKADIPLFEQGKKKKSAKAEDRDEEHDDMELLLSLPAEELLDEELELLINSLEDKYTEIPPEDTQRRVEIEAYLQMYYDERRARKMIGGWHGDTM